MLETYKAKIHGNQIVWHDETPEAVREKIEIDVFVTILTEDKLGEVERPSGLAKGQFVVPDDFDAPLPEDVLAEFEN